MRADNCKFVYIYLKFFWKKLNSRKLHELIHGVIHSTLSRKLIFYLPLIRMQYTRMHLSLPSVMSPLYFLTFLIKCCKGSYRHLTWRILQQYLRALWNAGYMFIWNKRKPRTIRKLLCVCVWQKYGRSNVNRCVKIAQFLCYSQ